MSESKNIFQPDFEPPKTFETEEIVIFPTNEAFYLSDHVAVMRSQRGLRLWSQSDWPGDSFTPEENREDLLLHVADNKNHAAYGYMIYAPDHKTCFGSLYVNPITSVLDNYALTQGEAAALKAYEAKIDFWVLDDELNLEKKITESIRDWLGDGWGIRPLLACRREMRERQAIYQALGLELFLDLTGKDSKSNLMLYRLN